MTHNERVTAFLASKNLTMEQALALPKETQNQLDDEFRAARHNEVRGWITDAKQLSRPALKALLPVGTKLTMVFCLGGDVEKPRTVAAHKSYGFEMAVPDRKDTSRLAFEPGETYFVKDGYVTVVDSAGLAVVRYRIEGGL